MATQNFTKSEVKKLCANCNKTLTAVHTQIAAHIETLKSTDSWWQKLLHDRNKEWEYASKLVSEYRRFVDKLESFANAESGTPVPSLIVIDEGTYAKLTKSETELFKHFINQID